MSKRKSVRKNTSEELIFTEKNVRTKKPNCTSNDHFSSVSIDISPLNIDYWKIWICGRDCKIFTWIHSISQQNEKTCLILFNDKKNIDLISVNKHTTRIRYLHSVRARIQSVSVLLLSASE